MRGRPVTPVCDLCLLVNVTSKKSSCIFMYLDVDICGLYECQYNVYIIVMLIYDMECG